MAAYMAAPETVKVERPTVKCDGGGGALGHPAVYLNMGEQRSVDCPYCGRRFVLSETAEAAH